jgi:dTDP-4-amino-4,6-dideoxygalactose transaminase
MMNKISNKGGKLIALLRTLLRPYQVGFVQSHSYLSSDQLTEINEVLNSDSSENILNIYEKKLSSLIGDGYGLSFAAGRMAFYTLLKCLDIGPGDEVILPGFTCSVMPNAVFKTGAEPVYSDIDVDTFGSSADSIRKNLTQRTKAVVAQHSFGIPCNIEEIADVCTEHNLILIEDSAISFCSNLKGISVGNWGDAAIFSTDHSKPINTILGGFFYTKNKPLYDKLKSFHDKMPLISKSHEERLYKQFLFEKKNYVPSRYPRAVFFQNIASVINRRRLDKFAFLIDNYTKDISSERYPYPAKMPSFLARIGLFELDRWELEKGQRKELLNSYISAMSDLGMSKYLPKAYFDGSRDIVPLRFVFLHPKAEQIKKKMSKYIDVGWTWFCDPIICSPHGPSSLGYIYDTCPNAEWSGIHIVNWPCAVPHGWNRKIIDIFLKVMNEFKE